MSCMGKTIEIKCKFGSLVPVDRLNDLQNNLKELSDENFEKLSAEITETGFAFAPHVWQDPKTKKLFLLDGHQRVKTVQRLVDQGWKIGALPVVMVEAKNLKEAGRRVMQGVAQYGEVTAQGLFDFSKRFDFKAPEIVKSFTIPGFDLKAWQINFFEKPSDKNADGSQEIDGEGLSGKLVHTCPRCKFTFSSP